MIASCALTLSACRGLAAHAAATATPAIDGGLRDGTRDGQTTDSDSVLLPDLFPPDMQTSADAKVVLPIDETNLGKLLVVRTVPCVMASGAVNGTQVLADSKSLAFFDWAPLAKLAPATAGWVGAGPAAIVAWDLNACDNEDWQNPLDPDWGSAGLLIRGAKVVGGKLVLAATTTSTDMNLVDVTFGGAWEGDDFGIYDIGLPMNLVQPVNGMKTLLLELAGL